MSVYHRLQWAPEPEDIDRESINDAKPEDYSDTYRYLINLRCILIGDKVLQNTIN